MSIHRPRSTTSSSGFISQSLGSSDQAFATESYYQSALRILRSGLKFYLNICWIFADRREQARPRQDERIRGNFTATVIDHQGHPLVRNDRSRDKIFFSEHSNDHATKITHSVELYSQYAASSGTKNLRTIARIEYRQEDALIEAGRPPRRHSASIRGGRIGPERPSGVARYRPFPSLARRALRMRREGDRRRRVQRARPANALRPVRRLSRGGRAQTGSARRQPGSRGPE